MSNMAKPAPPLVHGGRYKRGIPCRCRNPKCGQRNRRKTLAMHPNQYYGAHAWIARCPRCERDLTPDRYRASGREDRANRCTCCNYPFPHRRKSWFCKHGTAGQEGWHYYHRGLEEYGEWLAEWRARSAPLALQLPERH